MLTSGTDFLPEHYLPPTSPPLTDAADVPQQLHEISSLLEQCAYALAGSVEPQLVGELICIAAESQRLARLVETSIAASD